MISPARIVAMLVLTISLSYANRARAQSSIAPPMVVMADHPTGVYRVGDTVHWTVQWKGDGPPPVSHYVLKSGGLTETGKGDLTFQDNVAHLDSTFAAPNTTLLSIDWKGAGPNNHVDAGVVAAPDQIKPAGAEPADFDAFWKSKVAELKRVSFHPQLTPGESDRPGVDYEKVTLDNVGGTHVQGQIARPTVGTKFPALLIVQWAGVYPLQKSWVTNQAKDGWLTLDIEAHDIPIDNPASYYTDISANGAPLHYYWNIGNDDRDKSYYLRMYLSCYQALEYLKSRPDWDGKTLVVTGTSQGGQQTLMLAGLHPKDITAAMVLVPAACDMLAPDAGRASGFPNWYFNTQGKDAAKVRDASRYYDPANFARRIRCPVLIGLGLADTTAPPSSIFATAHEIKSPKEMVILPVSGHQNVNGSQDPFSAREYGAWLPALKAGKTVPVQAEGL